MGGVAQVGGVGDGPPAGGGDLRGDVVEAVGAAGGEQDGAAGAGEAAGHDRPQAGGGAGDDRRLAVEPQVRRGWRRRRRHRATGAIRSATAVMTPALGARTTRAA